MEYEPRITVVHKAVKPRATKKDPAHSVSDPCIRAENEDDDGYDPYSDRQELRPLFERDPWD